MPTHTPEPWTCAWTYDNGEPCDIAIRYGAHHIAAVHDLGEDRRDETEANADRIVACVNACKGINPDAVPDLLAALRRLCLAAGKADALQHAGLTVPPEAWSEMYFATYDARAAIAKATAIDTPTP